MDTDSEGVGRFRVEVDLERSDPNPPQDPDVFHSLVGDYANYLLGELEANRPAPPRLGSNTRYIRDAHILIITPDSLGDSTALKRWVSSASVIFGGCKIFFRVAGRSSRSKVLTWASREVYLVLKEMWASREVYSRASYPWSVRRGMRWPRFSDCLGEELRMRLLLRETAASGLLCLRVFNRFCALLGSCALVEKVGFCVGKAALLF